MLSVRTTSLVVLPDLLLLFQWMVWLTVLLALPQAAAWSFSIPRIHHQRRFVVVPSPAMVPTTLLQALPSPDQDDKKEDKDIKKDTSSLSNPKGAAPQISSLGWFDGSLVPPHFVSVVPTNEQDKPKDKKPPPPSSTNSNPVDTASNHNNNDNDSLSSSICTGFRETLYRLAKWSLEDYEWRSALFKSNQANRMVEQTLARMQGKAPSYVRPMDATTDTIFGQWETSAVTWLEQVMDEEGRRARQIVAAGGQLIRPIELSNSNTTTTSGSRDATRAGTTRTNPTQSTSTTTTTPPSSSSSSLGPLGQLERRVVEWIGTISSSEGERVRTNTLRPMDLDQAVQGPLGRLEGTVSNFLQDLRESELLRLRQSQVRGGAWVRPIDVPGPMGELELWIGQVLRAEELRAVEQQEQRQQAQEKDKTVLTTATADATTASTAKQSNESTLLLDPLASLSPRRLVVLRPKDATIPGPLGQVEAKAFEFLDRLSAEEMDRLRSIEQYLRESRPMEQDRQSFWGAVEALVVGLVRAPLLLVQVVNRVRELWLDSQVLPLPTTTTTRDDIQGELLLEDNDNNESDVWVDPSVAAKELPETKPMDSSFATGQPQSTPSSSSSLTTKNTNQAQSNPNRISDNNTTAKNDKDDDDEDESEEPPVLFEPDFQ